MQTIVKTRKLRCDNPLCKTAELTVAKGYFLPLGWYSLAIGYGDKKERALINEVCSKDCLLKLLEVSV